MMFLQANSDNNIDDAISSRFVVTIAIDRVAEHASTPSATIPMRKQ